MDIDTTAALADVRRGLTSTTRNGASVRLLSVRRRYAAEPAEVWSALTEPDRIGRWIAPVTGDLEVGGRYQLENQAGGTVEACEPPSRLSVTWEFGGHVSWVDVTLTPDDGGTQLLLEHSAPTAEDHWLEYGPGAVGLGWEAALMGLAGHLGAPEAPRPAPEELPDLTEFFRTAGTAWGEVAIGAGEDPRLARAAAERCVAAYTVA